MEEKKLKKNRVLFVTHHMTVGGVQKSLLSALNAIDYQQNDVDLYIRKNRTTLIQSVNSNVNVIINDDTHHYYRKPYAVLLQIAEWLSRLFGTDSERIHRKLANYIRSCEMSYEHKKYFSQQTYDVAIAYVQGPTTYFVDKYVNAKKKVMFYQGSEDQDHELHESTLPNYDLIVVEHESIKCLVLKWYPNLKEERIVVVNNYVDREALVQKSLEQSIDKDSRPMICTCGRMAQGKGFDLAVQAAKLMKEDGYKFIWYFVGDGPEREKVQDRIAEYGLEEEIVLTGMLNNPYPYIRSSDIFVQPSYAEALSVVALESQVLCTPIVSTKTAGGCAMIKEGVNGILTDIDARSLANGVEKLLKDDNLRKEIKESLNQTDYTKEDQRYSSDWRKLLEV